MNVSCPECSTIYRVDPAKIPQGGVRARCSTCNGVISIGLAAASPVARKTPTDPIGDAFAQKRPSPAPFMPAQSSFTPPYAPFARSTPSSLGTPVRTPPPAPRVPTPPSQARIGTPPAQPRVATPPAQARVATPMSQPKVPTPPANPRTQTPVHPAPSLGASLPPVRSTPQTPWQPAAPAPISVPPVTPPSPSPTAAAASRGPSAPGAPTPASTAPAPGERRPINPFLARDPGLRAKRLARALVSDMVAYYPAKHSEGLENGTLKELFKDEIKKSYDEYVGQVGAEFARTTTHFQESLNEVLGAGKKIF